MASDETVEGVWRDEERLPLADLTRAVATSPVDGQTDDLTGNDAGIDPDSDPAGAEGGSRRPDFSGRTGPA